MPISTATYSQARCFVDFEELLPEGIDKKILIEKTGNATEFFLLANNNYSANDLIFSKEPLSFDRVIKTESYLQRKEKILGKNRFPKVYELDIDLDEKSLFPHRYMNDEEYHYIIKYFDRYKGYKFQRKEFSSYLGLDSENKYRTSSEKLFDMASKVLLREEDRVRMLEYYFYSFVIKHEDMHTKNISTIYDNGKLFLAPLYDIATTGFYNGIRNYESHLPINGKQTNIRPKDLFIFYNR